MLGFAPRNRVDKQENQEELESTGDCRDQRRRNEQECWNPRARWRWQPMEMSKGKCTSQFSYVDAHKEDSEGSYRARGVGGDKISYQYSQPTHLESVAVFDGTAPSSSEMDSLRFSNSLFNLSSLMFLSQWFNWLLNGSRRGFYGGALTA